MVWALAARDPDHANQLTARATELLNRSMIADDALGVDFDQVVMEFNNEQMRPRVAQQQQQQQAHGKSDEE